MPRKRTNARKARQDSIPNSERKRRKKRKIAKRDGWRCHYCPEYLNIETATLDHVVPKSEQGPDATRNLVLACRSCNEAKGNMSYKRFAG